MYNVKICKSGCSRVQGANICYLTLHYITIYCASHALCASSCIYVFSYHGNVSPFTLQYIVRYTIYLYIMCLSCSMCLQLVSCTCLYSSMLFPVWCSALILTDWQSNALTPSICSMVTSLMDVMSWLAYVTCYVVMYIAVFSVLSIHSIHGHCQVFCLHLSTFIL